MKPHVRDYDILKILMMLEIMSGKDTDPVSTFKSLNGVAKWGAFIRLEASKIKQRKYYSAARTVLRKYIRYISDRKNPIIHVSENAALVAPDALKVKNQDDQRWKKSKGPKGKEILYWEHMTDIKAIIDKMEKNPTKAGVERILDTLRIGIITIPEWEKMDGRAKTNRNNPFALAESLGIKWHKK